MNDLTVSKIERLNVLNNRFAIEKMQKTWSRDALHERLNQH